MSDSETTHKNARTVMSRREVLKAGLGMAAASAAAPLLGVSAATAQQDDPNPPSDASIITRNIPSTNESIPAIGLGTFLTFDTLPGANRDNLREVMQRFWEAGGRLIDTSPLYGMGEITVGDFAPALGISDQMFVSNKIWSTGEFLADESHARRSLELSQHRLWRTPIDLMHCHNLVNVDFIVPYLQAWKREGLIRYVGISHHENLYMPILLDWIQRTEIDVVQVNYSIFNRQAEERLIPTAAERGTAVFVNLSVEKARLFKVVEGRPLPDFAGEFGAENWAQFFIKWVLGNPAVTCVLVATSNPNHITENMGALRGPLPDRQMRARMVRHMESIPGFNEIAQMPWYPGKENQYQGVIRRAQAALRSRLGG